MRFVSLILPFAFAAFAVAAVTGSQAKEQELSVEDQPESAEVDQISAEDEQILVALNQNGKDNAGVEYEANLPADAKLPDDLKPASEIKLAGGRRGRRVCYGVVSYYSRRYGRREKYVHLSRHQWRRYRDYGHLPRGVHDVDCFVTRRRYY